MQRADSSELHERPAVRQRTESNDGFSTSSRSEQLSLREELAEIGESIKHLQVQLSTLAPGSPPPDEVLRQLWALLWQLRPFLFLCSPATVRQWPVGGDVFSLHHRRHYVKDAAHVAIALRLYVVLLRFTVICPAAALHGCLTLLSVLAVLNDPRLRSWKDTSERVLDVFGFVLRAVQTSEAAVLADLAAVVQQLLAEVTAHFSEATDVESATQPPTALYLDLQVKTTPAVVAQAELLLSQLATSAFPGDGELNKEVLVHDLFSAHVCVETAYEARCIQAALLQLNVKLLEENVLSHATRESVVLLCDVACHLVSSAVPGAEGGVVNRVQHETAWQAIRFLVHSHRLLPHVQGPLLLSVLTTQWSGAAAASIFDITLAEVDIFCWFSDWSDAALSSAVRAMERKGGPSALIAIQAQMWATATRWCLELFNAPSSGVAMHACQGVEAAVTTLGKWVTFNERFFLCAMGLNAGVEMPEATMMNAVAVKDSAEYPHYLQLLANELPLPTMTASLLCTQLPPTLRGVKEDLLFVPHRILSFFSVPAMPSYVMNVVERAKDCVDASAYRLLDANALAVLRSCSDSHGFPAAVAALCNTQAFCASLEETIQVVQHHESPSYAFLVQAAVVLLHFYPPDEEDAKYARTQVLPRAAHDLDSAFAARLPHKSATLPAVAAPLWGVLYRTIAASLFRSGSGLSWSRKVLTLSDVVTSTSTTLREHAAAMEAALCRLAGIAEALDGAFARALWEMADTRSSDADRFAPAALNAVGVALPHAERDEQRLARLRRSYDGMVNLFSIAMQFFSTVEQVMRSVERKCAQWQSDLTALNAEGDGRRTTSTGALVALTAVLTHASSLQVQLLVCKYTFAPIAGPVVIATKPAAALEAGRNDGSGKEKGKQRSPKKKGGAKVTTAVVVDVDDDDDDNNHNEEENAGKVKAGRNSTNERGHKDEEKAAENFGIDASAQVSAPAAVSKTQLLERLIEGHQLYFLPAAVAAAQVVTLPRKDDMRTPTASLQDGRATSADGGFATGASTSTPVEEGMKIDMANLRAALLRVVYAGIAFAPPAEIAAVRRFFALSVVLRSVEDDRTDLQILASLAVRELMMWTADEKTLSEASGGHRRALFLQWLAASDTITNLSNLKDTAMSSSSSSATSAAVVADATQDVISLLWRTRRCFQKTNPAFPSPFLDPDEAAMLLPTVADVFKLQETCLVACEFATQEARGWLSFCFDLYTVYRGIRDSNQDAAVAVMGLCVETARDVMTLFAWSATDLLRFRERPFVFSSFLAAVVDKEDRDMKVVLTASLDVLGRYVISAEADSAAVPSPTGGPVYGTTAFVPGSDVTRARLRRLMEREDITEWNTVAGAVAYVLYECSGKPFAKQTQYLAEIMSCVDKGLHDVPAVVRSSKHIIAFHLVSLEADAQLLARDQRRRSGRGGRRSFAVASPQVTLARRLGAQASRFFATGDGSTTSAGSEEGTSVPQAKWMLPSLREEEPDDLDAIAFSVFERAVEQMVTLCESVESTPAVEQALRKPVGRTVAAEELWKSMFAVLDSIYKAIRIEPTPRTNDDGSSGGGGAVNRAVTTDGEVEEDGGVPGSLRTRRRWLLGLASFIRFMGPQTTPIALMLPTLLERCSQLPSLVPFVCVVWKELVCACTEEYLADSAPSIALSLVSLERHAAPHAEARHILTSAVQHLYHRTEAAVFWDAYKAVLGTSSELVALILSSRKLDEEAATASSKQRRQDDTDAGRANDLLTGFIEVMRSGSLQSSTVFVRALYDYLAKSNTAKRAQFTRAAACRPEVVQTLLRCAEADSESAVYAMRCISILGAVTSATSAVASVSANTTPDATALNAETAEVTRSSLAISSASSVFDSAATAWSSMAGVGCVGGQALYLDAETVLNWRKFAFILLREYFPHVFASTADPVLHNCIAFAVQELIRASTTQERLQHKGVKLRNEDVVHVDELERYPWWSRLTPHVKQLLGGFTTTRYSLTVNWKTQLRKPEYTPNMSYRRWLFNFFNHLVVSCEGWFAEMVQPLRNVAKRNSSLILYLLPYLVVHLLESGNPEDEQYLECEMKTVMEAVLAGGGGSSDEAGGGHGMTLRSQSLYEAHPDTVPLHEPREHAHTILSILEDVEQLRWTLLRNRGKIPCVFDQQEQSEGACLHLAERYVRFVRLIPWTLRCRAAMKVGSHIRALRCIENQRRMPYLPAAIQAVPLQRIFAALGDRESSRSIHRASPGLSLEDTAFSFENNGDWLAALSSSELVLQHRPFSGPHQLTALHCMNELGELYMTSRYAASLLALPPRTDGSTKSQTGTNARLYRGSTTFSQLDAGAAAAAGEGVSREESAAELRSHVQAYANEAAWRLGQWDSLLSDNAAQQATAVAGSAVSLAMPAAFLQKELSGLCALPRARAVTDVERLKVVPMIRTPCQEDLTTQGYTFTLLLHALGDIDAVSDLLCANIAVADMDSSGRESAGRLSGARSTPTRISASFLPSGVKNEIIQLLSLRESYVEDTISAREPLLSLHRMIYRELGVPQKVAETWLKQSELLRDAGLGEAALTAARQAAYECPDHIVHTTYYALVANLLHDTQSATPAIEFARECVNDVRIPAVTRAHLQMLLTNWLIETGSERPERVFAEYEKARDLDRSSELVYYQMAVFYDHLHTLARNASEAAAAQVTTSSPSAAGPGDDSGSGSRQSSDVSAAVLYNAVLMHQMEMVEAVGKYANPAMLHFGKALLRGTEKASVSLPRMLTLWLDSAAFLGGVAATPAGKLDGRAAALVEDMNNKVRSVVLSTVGPIIPPGVMMTALPQILSRLAHPVTSVRAVLCDIVLHLMSFFPQQCLWLVLPMALSKEGPREIVETQIIKPFADTRRNEQVLRYAKAICDTLLSICNCPGSLFVREQGLTQLSTVDKVNPMLPRARFILPVLSNLTPNVTADTIEDVFPSSPCFDHFEDRVVVMRSLQKPKRIWVATSEGREMSFLCKAKDEPRKDIRMMEVATLMNSFFLSDPEAKRKRFSLRRYSVTALCDDCAIIEWLNDAVTLSKVAVECYSFDRSGVHISQVRKWLSLVDENKITKVELFNKYIFPEAPPVMHQWLDRSFTSNQSWYEARTLFTQSTALWSIAGHIVGLGDRHTENIMIDLVRGELMHVDFACMFDKGERLEIPERVRFRLTQNLTDAMGVLGAYGPFQATCEVALRCEMKNKSAVMSIVETLLHEPLVEWLRQSSRENSSEGPKQLMERVSRRLDGFLDLYSVPTQRDTLALNVESQVSKLIYHSSDLNNLSQMYIWWMAWI